MHTLGAAKPAIAQLRVGGLQRVRDNKYHIVDIQSRMPNCQDPDNAHFTHLEDVYFTYRKIVWTHEVSGTSGSDDWRSPVAG
jgi:type VI secretion system Hcp family effector